MQWIIDPIDTSAGNGGRRTINGKYDKLIALASELEGFSGYLTTEDLKARNVVRGQYTQERNAVVFRLLQDMSGDEARAAVRSDMATQVQESPDWAPFFGNIEDDLLSRIAAQSNRHPWLRVATHFALPALFGLGVVVYFGAWFYNDLDVSAPGDTRIGLVQRAESYQKSRTFDEWNSGGGRRQGLKAILLMPIKPDEAEQGAAVEFIDLVFGGAAYLEQEGQTCGDQSLMQASTIEDRHLELADRIAADLLDPATQWENPAAVTVLASVARQFPCVDAAETPALVN